MNEQIEADLAKLMNEAWGRRIAWWLLDMAGIYHLSYRDNPQAMAFAEGRRAFGVQFLDWVATNEPDNYLLMQQEARHERNIGNRKQRSNDDTP